MKKPKIETIKEALILWGWKEDRYGHMQKTAQSGTPYRVKVQAISLRLEKRIGSDRFKVSNAYLKDVIVDDGKVQIGKVVIGDKP
ncbi:hypothetical protein [Robertmurraya sp.]|uniref:hypothetical protein n=1 Tax=Robertmurraya sp. TaxID=2837525 RepID=UPI003704287B